MKIRFHPGIASIVGSAVIRALGTTLRIEWRELEYLEKARKMSRQVIFSSWHGRLFVLTFSLRHRQIQVLASEHPDGDLMGRTITRLGFGHLKGSTSRGGARAIRNLAAALKSGLDVGLTVDGPRGPRGVVQQGVVELSRLTGTAVIPVSDTSRSRCLFNSWDRFQVPYPFAKVVVSYGEPFMVPHDASPEEREEYRLLLQERLNTLTTKLDADMGHSGSKVWPHEDS